MSKTVFIPNRWIKFLFNGKTCIGTTYLYDENDKDYEPLYQLVFFITVARKSKTINFSECTNIRYLKFIEKQNNFKNLSMNNKNTILNTVNNISELAKKQINNISRN